MDSTSSRTYCKILIPVDGSAPSMAALQEAIKITSDRAHVVRLVHLADMPHWGDSVAPKSVGDILLESRRASGKQVLSEGM